MRHAAAILICLAAAPGAAPAAAVQDQPDAPQEQENAAHRADRLRTQQLNERAPQGYPAPRSAPGYDHGRDDYARAQADYRAKLAAWRRRVAACENGYYTACQQ